MNRSSFNRIVMAVLIIGNIFGAYAYFAAARYRNILQSRPVTDYFNYIKPVKKEKISPQPTRIFGDPALKLKEEMLLENPELAFNAKTVNDSETWKRKLRERLKGLLGLHTAPNKDLNAKVIEETVVGSGIVRETVTFEGYTGRVIGYVFIPKGNTKPVPAIVVFSGHGYGIAETAGIIKSYQNSNALELAKRGFVTITIENRGFGLQQGMRHFEDIKIGFIRGIPVIGLMIYDGIKAIDYICTRKEVDLQRIGVCGVSLGGELALYVAALDDRVKCAVIAGFLTSYKNLITTQNCWCFVVPGLIKTADYADIASLIAPRPLCFQTGIYEGANFDVKEAERVFAKIEKAYEVYNRKENLNLYKFEGGHEFKVDNSNEWFQNRLKFRADN